MKYDRLLLATGLPLSLIALYPTIGWFIVVGQNPEKSHLELLIQFQEQFLFGLEGPGYENSHISGLLFLGISVIGFGLLLLSFVNSLERKQKIKKKQYKNFKIAAFIIGLVAFLTRAWSMM